MNKIDTPSTSAVATVVAAFAQRPDVTSDQIVDLARRLLPVFATESTAGLAVVAPRAVEATAATTRSSPVPALPLSEAVTDDKVFCLCCGKGFTMLKRHLNAEHGLTEEEYRKVFELPDSMPLVAPNYSERKAAYAKQAGLGKYSRETPEKPQPRIR